MLKKTPLHDFHEKAGAKLVDFAGWHLPMFYRSIQEEHVQTRTSGGLFDVSHMGRIHFKGADAVRMLDLVCTRKLADAVVGQCRYGLICDASGGVLDDVIVARDNKHWLMVCNASNREKLLAHFRSVRQQHDLDVDIVDQTEATAMVALQGPRVMEKIAGFLGDEVAELKRYRFTSGSIFLIGYTILRTGYTGEDGVELIFSARTAGMVIGKLAGRFDRPDATIKPAGLGARDTLRLEAGMPLYGHELSEQVDPISAGLEWACSFDKDFLGKESLEAIKLKGPARRLVGLVLEGKRIARQGAIVLGSSSDEAGIVTSGTLSPTLGTSIAMAYVDSSLVAPGTSLEVDLRSERVRATVTPLPFYKRP